MIAWVRGRVHHPKYEKQKKKAINTIQSSFSFDYWLCGCPYFSIEIKNFFRSCIKVLTIITFFFSLYVCMRLIFPKFFLFYCLLYICNIEYMYNLFSVYYVVFTLYICKLYSIHIKFIKMYVIFFFSSFKTNGFLFLIK